MRKTSSAFKRQRIAIEALVTRLERHQRDIKEILVALRQLSGSGPLQIDDGDSLDSIEKRLVAGALERAEGNQAEAARILGIGRDRLRYKMAKYRLASATAKARK